MNYREEPTAEDGLRLEKEFDDLCLIHTGYEALDERITKTKAKKDNLLMVLKHPDLPLHNNASELRIRQRARKRDVNFRPPTEDEARSWDIFASLAETTK
ncbi:MAG: hypothetical protein HPY85_02440 [Anaerolineae bacterium]|nr:hypothetical protein [Anaerolineae bacterium]